MGKLCYYRKRIVSLLLCFIFLVTNMNLVFANETEEVEGDFVLQEQAEESSIEEEIDNISDLENEDFSEDIITKSEYEDVKNESFSKTMLTKSVYNNMLVNSSESIQNVRTWNFSDEKFDAQALGDINSNRTVGGLTFYANPTKYMYMLNNGKTINGKAYSRFLALCGRGEYAEYNQEQGNLRYRALGFTLEGKSDIYITAKSADYNSNFDYSPRKLKINNEEMYFYEPETQVIRDFGDKQVIIYGEENISIYEITVVNKDKVVSYETINKTWTFDDSKYDVVNQNVSATRTVDGITFLPNTTIGSSKKTLDGVAYNKYINLPNAGNSAESEVYFELNNQQDITITAMSTSSTERSLQVVDGYGSVIGEMYVDSNLKSETFIYEGNKNDVYLRSTSGGVRVYGIKAEPVGTSSATGAYELKFPSSNSNFSILFKSASLENIAVGISDFLTIEGLKYKTNINKPCTIKLYNSDRSVLFVTFDVSNEFISKYAGYSPCILGNKFKGYTGIVNMTFSIVGYGESEAFPINYIGNPDSEEQEVDESQPEETLQPDEDGGDVVIVSPTNPTAPPLASLYELKFPSSSSDFSILFKSVALEDIAVTVDKLTIEGLKYKTNVNKPCTIKLYNSDRSVLFKTFDISADYMSKYSGYSPYMLGNTFKGYTGIVNMTFTVSGYGESEAFPINYIGNPNDVVKPPQTNGEQVVLFDSLKLENTGAVTDMLTISNLRFKTGLDKSATLKIYNNDMSVLYDSRVLTSDCLKNTNLTILYGKDLFKGYKGKINVTFTVGGYDECTPYEIYYNGKDVANPSKSELEQRVSFGSIKLHGVTNSIGRLVISNINYVKSENKGKKATMKLYNSDMSSLFYTAQTIPSDMFEGNGRDYAFMNLPSLFGNYKGIVNITFTFENSAEGAPIPIYYGGLNT